MWIGIRVEGFFFLFRSGLPGFAVRVAGWMRWDGGGGTWWLRNIGPPRRTVGIKKRSPAAQDLLNRTEEHLAACRGRSVNKAEGKAGGWEGGRLFPENGSDGWIKLQDLPWTGTRLAELMRCYTKLQESA